MTRKLLMTLAIVAITLAPSIGIGTAQARGFGGGFGGGGFHGGGFGGRGFCGGYGRGFTAGMVASIRAIMDMAFRRTVTTATDGYSWQRERRNSAGWAELWIFNALHFHPPAGGEYLSAAMPAYPESVSLELPFKLAKTKAE
jgi:hypothetical protein